jgi:hypothetical protein
VSLFSTFLPRPLCRNRSSCHFFTRFCLACPEIGLDEFGATSCDRVSVLKEAFRAGATASFGSELCAHRTAENSERPFRLSDKTHFLTAEKKPNGDCVRVSVLFPSFREARPRVSDLNWASSQQPSSCEARSSTRGFRPRDAHSASSQRRRRS